MFARLATEEDAAAVAELVRMDVEETVRGHKFVPKVFARTWRRYLRNGNPVFHVVDDRQEVVAVSGYAVNRYLFTTGFFLEQIVIYVRPDRRGTRAAVLLTKNLIAECDRLGALEITGGNDNSFQSERTARFLSHFGFERVGVFMKRSGAAMRHGQEERRRRG